MSEHPSPTSCSTHGPFLPLLLLGLSLVLFLGWQIRQASATGDTLRTQMEQRAEAEKQARAFSSKFEGIAKDIISLAPEDETARAVVNKYGIRLRQESESAAPTATP